MKNGFTNTCTQLDFLASGSRKKVFGFSVRALISAALVLVFSASALADEMSLLVNGKAIHINPPAGKDLNQSNWGLGLQYDWAPVRNNWIPFASASGFIDSNYNPSYYAGGGALRRFQYDGLHVDLGAIGFFMIRKGYNHQRPFLGALPAFSVGNDKVSLNVTYIPKVEPKVVALWFFQLKINFSNFR
ncbi:MAG: hypothetical protein ACYC9J_08835 [Sulfuricaulis sp.]